MIPHIHHDSRCCQAAIFSKNCASVTVSLSRKPNSVRKEWAIASWPLQSPHPKPGSNPRDFKNPPQKSGFGLESRHGFVGKPGEKKWMNMANNGLDENRRFTSSTCEFSLARCVELPKAGWWLGHPSEKYEFVNWDDDSNPILMGK